MKQTKDNPNRWRVYTIFLDWKNQYFENDYIAKNNLQIQCNPNQRMNSIFHRIRKKYLQFEWKLKDHEQPI